MWYRLPSAASGNSLAFISWCSYRRALVRDVVVPVAAERLLSAERLVSLEVEALLRFVVPLDWRVVVDWRLVVVPLDWRVFVLDVPVREVVGSLFPVD